MFCIFSVQLWISHILQRSDDSWENAVLSSDDILELNQDIQEVNALLSEFVCLDSIRMIPHPFFYQKKTIRRHLLAKDGLHLSYKGVTQLFCNFSVQLKKLDAANEKNISHVNPSNVLTNLDTTDYSADNSTDYSVISTYSRSLSKMLPTSLLFP